MTRSESIYSSVVATFYFYFLNHVSLSRKKYTNICTQQHPGARPAGGGLSSTQLITSNGRIGSRLDEREIINKEKVGWGLIV